ncbi:MAG: bactofilin family protein [Alphaproteobacteria bacterium]
MFSKPNKISDESTKPQAVAQATAQAKPATPAPIQEPPKAVANASPTPPSIISAELTLTGNLASTGEIHIDGKVDGDITSRALTVGEKGVVTGSVTADSVRICGTIKGEIKGKNVVLTKTAEVTGDIVHETLTIEAGAFLDGNVRRAESAVANTSSKVSVLKPPA